MEKKIILKFRGNNGYEGGGSDKTEFLTKGSLVEKNGKYYIKYTEAPATPADATVTTTMKIDDSKVTVLRYGETNTQMVMETGRKHMSYYETPYGTLLVGVIAENISLDIGEKRGKIRIDYDLEVNEAMVSRNTINLSYEEIGGESL